MESRALSLGVNLLSREGNSQKWRMKDKTGRLGHRPPPVQPLRLLSFIYSPLLVTVTLGLNVQGLNHRLGVFIGDQENSIPKESPAYD